MSNLAAENLQLLNAAALQVEIPGQEPIEDPRIEAISVTSEAGVENQATPFRVAGQFNTAGGFTISFTTRQPVDLSGPDWQQLSDDKTQFALVIFDINVINGEPITVAAQRYISCTAVVNTTYDAPKAFEVTVTATSREPVVRFQSAA